MLLTFIDKTIELYLETSGKVCIEGPKWCGKIWTSVFHANSEFLVGDPNKDFWSEVISLSRL